MKPHGTRWRNWMLPARYMRQHHVIAVNRNKPVDQADESRKIDLKWRNAVLRSLAIRLAHFTSVAKAVTPYRARGFGDSMASKITRAQSSGVDFELSRPSFAPAHAPE